jgi:fermentation-respiration switch protein FrsA (DUF1100 family)
VALAALLGVSAGCRESLERGLIYHPAAALVGDPGHVGLGFRDLTFRAQDGGRLHGWLVPGPRPTTLLWFHGNAGNISHRLENLRLFVDELGVGVFIFDYRGYGRSEGVPSEAGLALDARAARAALLAADVRAERIVYFGRSLGAAVALDLALDHPPPALILESPFLSIPAMANHLLPGAGLLVRTRWDSSARITGLRSPLLVLHGDADEVVPFAQGRALFDRAPGPKAFHAIAGARHNDTYRAGREYSRACRDFLRAHGLLDA